LDGISPKELIIQPLAASLRNLLLLPLFSGSFAGISVLHGQMFATLRRSRVPRRESENQSIQISICAANKAGNQVEEAAWTGMELAERWT